MASKPHRITEADVGIAVLQVLAERDSGEATVRHLKRRSPEFVKFSPSDREDLRRGPTKSCGSNRSEHSLPQEHPWQSVLEGFIDSVVRGRWRITKAGLLHLKHKGLI